MKLSANHMKRFLNAGLRLTTLVTKMGLTFYMGRYLSLHDLGMYGVVNGTVIILMTTLGMRLDYVMSRELVGASAKDTLIKMRDQTVFCVINYLVLAAAMTFLALTDLTGISCKILFAIFVLSVLENLSGLAFANLVAMGNPLRANILFFIRSGLWVFPVVGLGVAAPAYRTSLVIFVAWAIGASISLVATLWLWRHMPWKALFGTSVNWKWVRKAVHGGFFIWLGAIGTTAGSLADRFVVAHNLGLDLAGVVTFYGSFTGALFALIDSGIISFSYPRLIALHKAGKLREFRKETRNLALQIAGTAGVLALLMGITVPAFGAYLKGPVFTEYASTFWMLLLAIWIRENAQTLYYLLYARHQDKAIWLGDLIFLALAAGSNAVLVPLIGFKGIGYGAIIAQSFILFWRIWHVRYGYRPHVKIEEIPESEGNI